MVMLHDQAETHAASVVRAFKAQGIPAAQAMRSIRNKDRSHDPKLEQCALRRRD